MTVFVEDSGISGISDYFLNRYPNAVKRAKSMSVNDTARDARKLALDNMRKQINFPEGYLDEPERFWISQYATPDNAEAHLTARSRATSLRRFAVGDPTPESSRQKGAGGVSIEVAPGHIINMPSAFIISLNGGNFGVAMKIKPGQLPPVKKSVFDVEQLAHNYYIFYGPSVDQVFHNVSKDIAPEVTSMLSDEFQRQLYVQLGSGG